MLLCTAGPAAGQEFPLTDDEAVIGRATDVAVSIPDTSVSRKHALVRKTEDGWAISDLGSGNGTMLNGEAIADETQLSSDDVIALGDSEFTFVGPGGAAAPASAPEGSPDATLAPPARGAPARRPPVKTSRALGGDPARARPVRGARFSEDPAAKSKAGKRRFALVGLLFILIGVLGVSYLAVNKKKMADLAKRTHAAEEHEGELSQLLSDAKGMARTGKWVDAKAKLEELREADAEFEQKQVTGLLEVAEKEIPNQKFLLEATAAVKEGQLSKASKLLAQVKTSHIEQLNRLQGVHDLLDGAITQKFVEARGLAASQGDLAKMQQLKAMADDILGARPEDREATGLKATADGAIFRIQNPTAAPPPVDNSAGEVVKRYRDGDLAGAISLAEGCAGKNAQCKAAVGQLNEFKGKLGSIESASEDELYALFELDRKLAGGASTENAKQIRIRMAAAFYRKASSAKTTGNWNRAIEYARKVLLADPSNAGAQGIISEARNQAKDVYLRGYQLKDSTPDEAVRLFKEVMTMTPRDDEIHQKAEARLAELQGK